MTTKMQQIQQTLNNVDKSGAIAVWKTSDTDPKFAVTYGKSGEDSTMKVENDKSRTE